MPLDYTLWNLKEAAEELSRIITRLESGTDDGEFDTGVPISHVYHHLNTAWHARAASEEQVEECSEDDFLRWRRFPEDLISNFTGKAE